jgi:hypothetical protein
MDKGGGARPDWLEFVPPGGLWLLAGILTLILALAAKLIDQPGAQLVLLPAGLILAGIGIRERLGNNGTVTGTILTAGVLVRLLIVLGSILILMIASVVLVGPDERDIVVEGNLSATAPGGGLPEGGGVGKDHRALPFPWMFYTTAACLFLGLVLVAAVGIGLLLKWGIRGEYVLEEAAPGEIQTSTGIILLLGAVVSLLAYLAIDPAWDSVRSFLCVTCLVSIVGTMIIVLPLVWRKAVVSLLILMHFGGICTAITAIEPPGAPAPWVSSKLWLVFYRPYLQFTYMNNAYHFYSPEPGPAPLLWFRLEYANGQYQYVKIPNRSQSPVPLYYQRMLSITASLDLSQPFFGDVQGKLNARKNAGANPLLPIPMHPAIPEMGQYREPTEDGKRLARSYIQFVARKYPTMDGKPLSNIKLYRVTHTILPAANLAQGEHADDKWTYLPYYFGKFSPEGELLEKDDPFLYWLIPILRDPNMPGGVNDCQARHAGDQRGQ